MTLCSALDKYNRKVYELSVFKVQSLSKNSNIFVNSGSYGSFQSALISAKVVLARSHVRSARILNSKGAVLWIDNQFSVGR